jgi:hypothetical protein
MSKVTIYQYLIIDRRRGQVRKAPRWGTREAIERLRATVMLEDTATMVEESVINIGGFNRLLFDPHYDAGGTPSADAWCRRRRRTPPLRG